MSEESIWTPVEAPVAARRPVASAPPPVADGQGLGFEAAGRSATEDPFGGQRRGRLRNRIASVLAALAAIVAKFGAALKAALLALPNLKLFATAGTALVSVAAYSLWFGWTFALGFVVLLFLHEMGHVIALRREGIKASPPMFVPFLGAFISARSLGDNALAEARVGLAGPVLGSLAAAVVAVAALLVPPGHWHNFLLALAYIGFFLNLFNLLPVVPLDGGRAAAAMSPWMWFVGFGGLVFLLFALPQHNPILLIIVLFAGYQLIQRWRHRNAGTIESAAYYRVARRHRLIVAAVYIGLVVALVFGMDATHILSGEGHSFAHL